MSGSFTPTPQQFEAIRTTGCSVLVSAAAGSGKTAVLAERCAYLVCDAPDGARCSADQLLVLTFTEAAAAEMRARIIQCIQKRVLARPADFWLQEQLARIETAQISTIDAFCLWMVRRWFSEAGVDPLAAVIDAEEADLLKKEVLDDIFAAHYAAVANPQDPLGTNELKGHSERSGESPVHCGPPDLEMLRCAQHDASSTGAAPGRDPAVARHSERSESRRAGAAPRGTAEPEMLRCAQHDHGPDSAATTSFPERFVQLVNDYGLGEDREIAGAVLKLHEFTTSLPDWRGWLAEAVEAVLKHPESVLLDFADALELELSVQVEHCREALTTLVRWGQPVAHLAATVRTYAGQVEAWHSQMTAPAGRSLLHGVAHGPEPCGHSEPTAAGELHETSPASPAAAEMEMLRCARHDGASEAESRRKTMDAEARLLHFERVRQSIASVEFETVRSPRRTGEKDPAEEDVREAGKKIVDRIKKSLFASRLRDRYALFSFAELATNLQRTAPYVSTLVELVVDFHEAYSARKRRFNVLDFADLERFAFELLSDGKEGKAYRPSAVARILQRRFAHVLVDEFQDIDPLQQAILQLVSRESQPPPHNLFAVGDVKQSIYRFRLAEPSLFIDRLQRFRSTAHSPLPTPHSGTALFLQSNYRSRPEILDAVNCVFRMLMGGGFGGIEYGPDEELRPGKPSAGHAAPVELHLVDRASPGANGGRDNDEEFDETGNDPVNDLEPAQLVLGDPARWTPIEREAYLIGKLIRQWKEADPARQYRDAVVLLRATKVNAERMACVLNAMGVPAFAQVGGSLFGAREIRDVTAALRVLDNPLQDIPLAAVLRSGIFGPRLSADELVEVRLLDRGAPFHEVVWRYARNGTDEALRTRLAELATTLDRYRNLARRRPLPETLWTIYERQGFLAYVAALPNGAQRRANLFRLHDLARRFSSFRRQGLHRFLQFLKSLESDRRELDVAASLGESEDVVRIMSIHQSKGMEFPLVFLAGLGADFNRRDRRGRIIFERKSRIGLKVVDTSRMLEYPSAAHHLVASEVERTAREEELRILYVAMTRAKEKLVLVGSCPNVDRFDPASHDGPDPGMGPTRLSIASASTALDWLLPIVRKQPGAGLFSVHCHSPKEMSQWGITQGRGDDRRVRQAVAQLEPLPAHEPVAADDAEVERLLSRVDFVYPRLATSSIAATLAASEFRGEEAWSDEPPAKALIRPRAAFQVTPSKYTQAHRDDAAYRGSLMHRVLQHLDFGAARGDGWQIPQLNRLIEHKVMTGADAGLIDRDALDWFISTPLAERIRAAGAAYRREFRFISMEPLEDIDTTLVGERDDHVLVRGIVDGILIGPDALSLIDFKTDAIKAEDVLDRCRLYEPQLRLYARAAAKLWRKPVNDCWLVFLTPRIIESVTLPQWPSPKRGKGF